MILKKLEIEGYRSFKSPVSVHIEKGVTIILGANDHGKTNLLESIIHLNEDEPFDADRDLNWDCAEQNTILPKARYHIDLTQEEKIYITERASIFECYNRTLEQITNTRKDLQTFLNSMAELDQKMKAIRASTPEISSNENPEEKENKSENAILLLDIEEEKKQMKETIDQLRVKLFELEGLISYTSTLIESDRFLSIQEALDYVSRGIQNLSETNQVLDEELDQINSDLKIAKAASDGNQENLLVNKIRELEKRTTVPRQRLKLFQTRVKNIIEATEVFSNQSLQKIYDMEIFRNKITVSDTVVLSRSGIGDSIYIDNKTFPFIKRDGKSDLDESLVSEIYKRILRYKIPHVILIKPFEKISDSVSSNEISDESNDFMRGIFYYAGFKRENIESVFPLNDKTRMQLTRASSELTKSLKESWNQGRDLQFALLHGADPNTIDLRIKDPSVEDRYVLASRRSSGFTNFFALKTILHCRMTESPSNSYIWIFDEPGLYLHPSGQHDLVQVLETLSKSNQILYTTHSIFMTNKNYPSRHRLIVKNSGGTKLDTKPFAGNWRSAIDALGVALPGSFLFASHVLLAEGDSDPVYLNKMLQYMISAGKLLVDINGLSIISTGESRHASALLQFLCESNAPPSIVLLFDGDRGGKNRSKYLQNLIDKYKIQTISLNEEETIEDYLIGGPSFYLKAASNYVLKLSDSHDKKVLKKLYKEYQENQLSKPIASWSRRILLSLAKLDHEPSPVGIAREYESVLSEMDILNEDDECFKKTLNLLEMICEKLELPLQTLPSNSILNPAG